MSDQVPGIPRQPAKLDGARFESHQHVGEHVSCPLQLDTLLHGRASDEDR